MRRGVVSILSPQARAVAGDVVLAGSGGSLEKRFIGSQNQVLNISFTHKLTKDKVV